MIKKTMKIERGLMILLVVFFILIVGLVVMSSIALVRSNDAKSLAGLSNLSSSFPNIFPLVTPTPQMVYGSLTIPLYTGSTNLTPSSLQGFGNHGFYSSFQRPVPTMTPRRNRFLPSFVGQDPMDDLIQNGNFTADPPLKDTETTSFSKSKIEGWTVNVPDTQLFSKSADPGDWGTAPDSYVMLGKSQKISQKFQVKESCGYQCSMNFNVRQGKGGSAQVRIMDDKNQIRSQTVLSLDTQLPQTLAFDWTRKEIFFFLTEGTYTLEISGETQQDGQQCAFTDISIIPHLSNQFAIDFPLQFKTIPHIQCTLVSDTTKHVSEFMKSVFLSQYKTTPCIIMSGQTSSFLSSVSVTNASFFTVDIFGPLEKLENVCAVELTINWVAIGVTA